MKFGDMFTTYGGPLLDVLKWNVDRNRAQSNLENSISMRVADAKRAGIHPLAALGVNPASGPTIPVGDTFSRMGQNMQNRRLNRQLLQANIETEKAKGKYFEAQARAVDPNNNNPEPVSVDNKSPFPGIAGQNSTQLNPDKTFVKPEIPLSQSPGVKVSQGPMEEYSTLSDGSVLKHPEKDKAEVMESDFVTQVKYASYNVISYAGQIEAYLWSKSPAAKHARRLLQAERPKVNPHHRNIYEYRYHPFKGRWFLTKIRNHSYLYAIGHGESYGVHSW